MPSVIVSSIIFIHQAPVVQKMDNVMHRINYYPVDKYWGNQLHYPLDSDLSDGYRYIPFEQLGPGAVSPHRALG